MGERDIVPPEYRLPLVFVGISCVALVGAILLFINRTASEPIRFSSDTVRIDSASQSARMLVVDVSGAVVSPGVYTLPFGSRVIDAITIAGGMTGEADGERIAATINQASILSDGAKVYIPKRTADREYLDVPSVASGTTVSINAASQDELETLSGVGPVTAKKIIDNRPYTSLEDMVRKKVVSQSLYDRLKSQLTL